MIDPPKESTCVFVFSVCVFGFFFLTQEAGLFPGVSEFVLSGDSRLTLTDASFFILLDMNSSAVV